MHKSKEYQHCQGCPLQGNTKVGTDGDPDGPICFVGRNPGAVEKMRGLPFVGPAGIRLDKVIADLKLEREDVFITNMVKCWTPNDAEPPNEAVERCWGYLTFELHRAKGIVVALGRSCQKALTEREVPHFSMIHPSAAIRRGLYEAVLRRDTRLLKKELAVWRRRKSRAKGGKRSAKS